MPAVEVRDRLVGFVEEVAERLPLRRQRENALLYVRGLIEHGGRKSLQPTLFRLEETPARYESMQQFLADSPWDAGLLVRACAERVACEIGVLAWIVDDTGIVKDGKHSPGVKRQYSGTLGKIGNCQITVSVHAVGERARCRWAGRCICPRSGARRASGGRRRRSPRASCSRRSRGWPPACASRRPGGRCRWRRCWPTRPTATTLPSARTCTSRGLSTWSRCGRRRASTDLRRASPSPSATARPAARAPSRGPTASPNRCGHSPRGCPHAPGRGCPAERPRRARTSRAASRSSVSSPATRSAATVCRRVRSG